MVSLRNSLQPAGSALRKGREACPQVSLGEPGRQAAHSNRPRAAVRLRMNGLGMNGLGMNGRRKCISAQVQKQASNHLSGTGFLVVCLATHLRCHLQRTCSTCSTCSTGSTGSDPGYPPGLLGGRNLPRPTTALAAGRIVWPPAQRPGASGLGRPPAAPRAHAAGCGRAPPAPHSPGACMQGLGAGLMPLYPWQTRGHGTAQLAAALPGSARHRLEVPEGPCQRPPPESPWALGGWGEVESPREGPPAPCPLSRVSTSSIPLPPVKGWHFLHPPAPCQGLALPLQVNIGKTKT